MVGERLRGIYSIREAEPVLNDYLASIEIDDDNSGFLFDWQMDNVNAFVTAVNRLERERNEARRVAQDQDLAGRLGAIQLSVQAAPWLRTRPPEMTSGSFVEDLVSFLEREAGGRCGHVFLAPNRLVQFGAIASILVTLQDDTLLQEAMEAAFPAAEGFKGYLVVMYHLVDSQVQRLLPNNLQPALVNGYPVRRLFI